MPALLERPDSAPRPTVTLRAMPNWRGRQTAQRLRVVRAHMLLPPEEGSGAAGLGDGGDVCHPGSIHASRETAASRVRTNRLPGCAAIGHPSGAPRRITKNEEQPCARRCARRSSCRTTVQLTMP